MSHRRRICFVGWGDHVHLERWAGHFASQGHDVSVVSFGGLGRYPPGVRQYRLGPDGGSARWAALKLHFLLWRIRPDIVHVHWAHFATTVRRAWRGPMFVTAWGSDIYRREVFTELQWQGLTQAMRSADLVTCDSQDLAATMRTAFALPAERIEVIQWGVDTELFRPDGPDLRESLGLQGREVVFSARNFTPLYNQETVVRAFAEVLGQRPNAVLLMKNYGGDADYAQRIRAEIDRLGLADHVRILDTVPYDEMPALYRSADVMVSVPLSDAAPMSLLEAMACGLPSVVCDLASLREWVTDDVNGYLVPASDMPAVAAALLRCLSDAEHARAMGTRARQIAIDRASQGVHMKAMARHYR